MKIALVYNERLPALKYGGVERVVVNLAKYYTLLGHQVFLLAGEGSELPDYESGVYMNHATPTDIVKQLPGDIEFVHLHQPERVKPSKPHLFSIHGNASPGESFFPNTNFVSKSHAYNHHAKYYVLQAVDISRFDYVEEKEDYYVFMAKAKWRVKNLKTSIDFARDLGVRLKVIGGIGKSDDQVEFMGMLGDHEHRLDILSSARALLYPTNWDEPCALAPLEAMACGTPVLGSANGCMPEIIKPGTGLITNRYEEFLSFHDRVSELVPAICREAAVTHFSAERQAKDYLSLINHVLNVGELDQSPGYYPHPESVEYLYKPTPINRLRKQLLGKI